MSKLTNEEIAKVFAMHLIHEVSGVYMDEQCTGYLTGITVENLTEIQWVIDNSGEETPDYYEYPQIKLLLTTLSGISDEHAIEVAKILGIEYSSTPESWDCLDITGLGNYLIDLFSSGYNLPSVVSHLVVSAFQYLISKGYAVPLWFGIDHWANGKTAIELCIAIDKTKM